MNFFDKEAATAYKEHMHELSNQARARLDVVQPRDRLLEKTLNRGGKLPRAYTVKQGQSPKATKKQMRQIGELQHKITNSLPTQKDEIHMIAGLNRGTKNIIAQQGGKLQHPKRLRDKILSAMTGGGYVTLPGNTVISVDRKDIWGRMFSPIHKITDDALTTAHLNALLQRHEAYETQYSKRPKGSGSIFKEVKNPKAVPKKDSIFADLFFKGKDGKTYVAVGNHYSGGVLAKEMRDTNRLSNRKVAKRVMDYRSQSGERGAIEEKINKDPYSKGKITATHISKAHNKEGDLRRPRTVRHYILNPKKKKGILEQVVEDRVTKVPDVNKYARPSRTEQIGERLGYGAANIAHNIKKTGLGIAKKLFKG